MNHDAPGDLRSIWKERRMFLVDRGDSPMKPFHSQNLCVLCRVRLRSSLDGAKAWLPSNTVSDVESQFMRSSWLGDTAGLSAHVDGTFNSLWSDKLLTRNEANE